MIATHHVRIPTPDDVHVWWIDLAAAGDAAILAPDERARAARFRHERDRQRWTCAHLSVRRILGGYLALPPQDVQFTHAEPLSVPPSPIAMGEGLGVRAVREKSRGERPGQPKPTLRNDPRLRFNLTHAENRAALAVAWEREVGIDLEPIVGDLDLPPLLAVACAPREAARIQALPADARARALLDLWTAKEAYLKGIGLGMFREPSALEVEYMKEGRMAVHDRFDPEASSLWTVRRLDAGVGWAAALAAFGAEPTLRTFRWPPAPDAPC